MPRFFYISDDSVNFFNNVKLPCCFDVKNRAADRRPVYEIDDFLTSGKEDNE